MPSPRASVTSGHQPLRLHAEGKRVLCGKHRLKGMCNLAQQKQRCQFGGGCRLRAIYGTLASGPLYCPAHKEKGAGEEGGLQNLVWKSCQHPDGCHRVPSFGPQGQARAVMCSMHAHKSHVRVRTVPASSLLNQSAASALAEMTSSPPVAHAALMSLRQDALMLGGPDPLEDGWHVRCEHGTRRLGPSGWSSRRSVQYVNRFGQIFRRRSSALRSMGLHAVGGRSDQVGSARGKGGGHADARHGVEFSGLPVQLAHMPLGGQMQPHPVLAPSLTAALLPLSQERQAFPVLQVSALALHVSHHVVRTHAPRHADTCTLMYGTMHTRTLRIRTRWLSTPTCHGTWGSSSRALSMPV